ncbi:MAG: aminotransferase class I/II-fold pyridoxal phosphate-dependent enzyme [Acidobacteria bacterium]|nr:aminotransferase class I/II-fold pyridoxal phosphate-dependent enzyme [Acidobacteriota bacterium]
MENMNHLAPHARFKIEEDNIFKVGAKAKAAKEQFGAAQVVDGSIGILLDDQGQLALMKSVDQATALLKGEELAPYAPIGGLASFNEDVVSYLFGQPKGPVKAIATAGATGAVSQMVWNMLSMGDMFITHDYFWSPYRAIARNYVRKLVTFQTFTETGGFNVAGALEEVRRCLDIQGRALLVINVPCHNPTGMDMTMEEARSLKDGLVALARNNPQKPITLLIDGAYWEFGDATANSALLNTFTNLPDNLLFTLAYSISKSLTRYGFRTGALAFCHSRTEVIDELVGTFVSSIRATWSNTTRIGQAVFSKIYRNTELRAQLQAEQTAFATLCNQRGATFVAESDRIGLPHTPYKKGFFTILPTANPQQVADRLAQERIFLVPMKNGVRIAFCALPTHQIHGLAERIAKFI